MYKGKSKKANETKEAILYRLGFEIANEKFKLKKLKEEAKLYSHASLMDPTTYTWPVKVSSAYIRGLDKALKLVKSL